MMHYSAHEPVGVMIQGGAPFAHLNLDIPYLAPALGANANPENPEVTRTITQLCEEAESKTSIG